MKTGKKAFCLTSFLFPDQTAEVVDPLKKKKKSDQDLFTEIDKMLHYLAEVGL